jgi:hypothetical protein
LKLRASHATVICLCSLLLFAAGCAQTAESCPPAAAVDLSGAEQFTLDEDLPFRFPLDDYRNRFVTNAANFAIYGMTTRGLEYHAAEDIHKPAGTPVYAMADGKVRYSGRMGGYGWLIIIDHPQANLYSLYGHLSPSRWKLGSGQVEKGDLIAYLGDSDENGGNRENPLRTHLHFAVRAGQMSDYPHSGQWRWMAGWIKPCPQDLGWLQPSVVITNQEIPTGGFEIPNSSFIEKWAIELIVGGYIVVGAFLLLIFGTKRDKPYVLLLSGGVLIAAGWYFSTAGWKMSFVIFGSASLLAVSGLFFLMRRFINSTHLKA